jgi:hypothetical protein
MFQMIKYKNTKIQFFPILKQRRILYEFIVLPELLGSPNLYISEPDFDKSLNINIGLSAFFVKLIT